MNTSTSTIIDAQNWRSLYTDALKETDLLALASRIDEAEEAIILRSHELFEMHSCNGDEAQAMDDAMYALHALCSCLKLETKAEAT